jgi:CheY-like chemotaxis protein
MDSLNNKVNKNILIIDDEIDVLNFLKIYVESLGWKATIASSTKEAFEYLKTEEFFLILTDIAMPEMDGYEFISKIKDIGINSQIVLMTGFGYNPKHTLIKIFRSTKVPCLFKPFNRVKLSEAIKQAYLEFNKDIITKYSSSEQSSF